MRLSLDQERLIQMLKESISLMCKNSLAYEAELNIEGLLGITLDKHEVLLVNINQSFLSEAWKQRQESDSVGHGSSAIASGQQSLERLEIPVSHSLQHGQETFSSMLEQIHMPHPVSLHQVDSVAGMRIIKPEVSPAKLSASATCLADTAELEPGEQVAIDAALNIMSGAKTHTVTEANVRELSGITTSRGRRKRKRKSHTKTQEDMSDTVVVIDAEEMDIKEEQCSDKADSSFSDNEPATADNMSRSTDRLSGSSDMEDKMKDSSMSNISHDDSSTITEQHQQSAAIGARSSLRRASQNSPRISVRRRRRPRMSDGTLLAIVKNSNSEHAEKSRNYRKRLKNRPDYDEMKRKDALRSKEYRRCRSEEAVQIDREKSRIRQQKFREKKKLEGIIMSRKKPCIRSQREYWRIKKQQSRNRKKNHTEEEVCKREGQ